MKINKTVNITLLISVFLILCFNVNNFNDQQNSIKDNLDNQLQNADLYQKELTNYKEINYESTKSLTPLDSKEAYAIVVGIADYPGTTSDLSYCDDDSQDIYSMLINDFNFKTENVYYLQDSVASKAAISDAFDQIASKIDADDIFFFYYSGHGGAGTSSTGSQSYSIDSPHPYSNDLDRYWNIYRSGAVNMRVHFDHFDLEDDYDYVLLGDTDLLSGLYYEAYTGYSTGFWSGWIPLLSDNRLYINLYTDFSITEWGFSIDSYEAELYDGTHFLCSYDSIPSTPSNYYMDDLLDSKLDLLNCDEKYVVLDACNTGGMIPEIQEIGRSIMTACQADEFSLESPSLQHGVFTNFFLESFNSATDSNADGVISMEESFSYTSSNTISYSGGEGYTHHPQQYDGISGESVLFTSFGALTLTPSGNSLSYSFYMYGTGLIEDLRIAAGNFSQTITYAVEDLTDNPATNTGFGYYSGTIQVNGATGITDYGIFAHISGNEEIFLNQTVSTDTDSDSIDDIIEIMFGMNISNIDSDSDGLDDVVEFYGITDPSSNDTDNDGLLDGEEIFTYFTDPTNSDPDNDLLSDGSEVLIHGTDPFNPDTDGDGMDDYYEVIYNLNPLINDTNLDPDLDNIPNIYEYGNNTNPQNADTDGDTIEDGDEILTYLTDPTTNDTDGEGLTDDFELFIYHTNATNHDTEGDGMDDFYEYTYSLDPFSDDSGLDLDNDGLINLLESQCGTNPNLPDTDGDFMTDYFEYNCNLNPLLNDANLDYDSDGLNNLLEFSLNSLADDTDSDDDLMPDLWEYNNELNLIFDDASLDADNDELNNINEYHAQTDPNNPDTDGDFMTDYFEYNCNLNPLLNDANLDYDSDGLNNLLEFLLNSLADDTDSDDDLMPDLWEYNNELNLIFDDASLDADNDELNNINEYQAQTDPNNPDTDADGLFDGLEISTYFTDPLNPDTDGDGYSDGIEAQWGTDPLDFKISLNTIFFNVAGIAILASSSYSIVRTTLTNKKQKTHAKSKKAKLKVTKSKVYNAVKVEKKLKPKPKPKPKPSPYPKSTYAQSYSKPSYAQVRPRYESSNIEFKKLLNLIQYGLPPPKSIYSAEGKKAQNIANLAFRYLDQGRFADGFNNMISALIMGVPEPMNNRIKLVILKSLSQFSNDLQSKNTAQKASITKKCSWCGKENKIINKFCLNCGRGL